MEKRIMTEAIIPKPCKLIWSELLKKFLEQTTESLTLSQAALTIETDKTHDAMF